LQYGKAEVIKMFSSPFLGNLNVESELYFNGEAMIDLERVIRDLPGFRD
jgi:hypothetical protein